MLDNFVYRLKAQVGDTTLHDELGVSGELAGTLTRALIDRGAGDVAWRLSGGAASIAIPGNVIDMLAAGTGATMAFTLKMVNSGTIAYRTILNVGPDVLPLAHASASNSPGFSFARHGASSVRATGSGAIFTNNITSGAEDRTYVIRLSTNKSGTYEVLEIWANDPANPSVAMYISSSNTSVPNANSGTWDTLSIDCSSGVIVELKDLVIWPDEKTDAECSSVVVNGIRASLDVAVDTTPPVFTGTPTHTVTTTSGTVDWSACNYSDNVGVIGFQTALDGAEWVNRGMVTSHVVNDLANGSEHTLLIRAMDAAGLFSEPLSRTFTTDMPAADAVPPTLVGEIFEVSVSHNAYTLQCPEATDNIGVVGYQAKIGDGDWQEIGMDRIFTYEGAMPDTLYPNYMRAYDESGLFSEVLTLNVQTSPAPDVYFVTDILCDNAALPYINATNIVGFIQDVVSGDRLWTHNDISTDQDGVAIVHEPLALRGKYYRLIYQRPDGTEKPPEGMQTLMAN